MAAMDHDLYCCRFSVFRRSEFSGSQPDEWSVSFENGGYYDGGICFVSQHGTLVCYNVPFEISFYFPGGVVNLRDDLCGMQLDLCEYGECGRFGVTFVCGELSSVILQYSFG